MHLRLLEEFRSSFRQHILHVLLPKPESVLRYSSARTHYYGKHCERRLVANAMVARSCHPFGGGSLSAAFDI